MALPILASDDKDFLLMQTTWSSAINPILANPLSNSIVLKNIPLVIGINVINHKLGRKLQGWILTRQRGAAIIYDTQDANNMQNLTLQLNSNVAVIVDLVVF